MDELLSIKQMALFSTVIQQGGGGGPSIRMLDPECSALTIDTLHKWHPNLNNNTLYIPSFVWMFIDKRFFYVNVRLRVHKYCYSNADAIYAKCLLDHCISPLTNM